MTYFEFFDNNATENICACLACNPDKVVLVGYKRTLLEEHKARYIALFEARNEHIEFEIRCISRTKLSSIVDQLSQWVEECDECAFGLTGGEDMYLVAVGIICERYKNVQMHRFNIRDNVIIDCDQDGEVIRMEHQPQLSVEENIRIYGGDIIYTDQKPNGTYRWKDTEELRRVVSVCWRIMREDPRRWNAQINLFDSVSRLRDTAQDALTDLVKKENLIDHSSKKKVAFKTIAGVAEPLCERGLITIYEDAEDVCIRYRDEEVKRLLTKAGQVLEMAVYFAAKDAREDDDTPVYNDVMTGVSIDWDGELSGFDTVNEIDVMMMHGMIPVFVSCKNGQILTDELYKLNTVAHRFGGKYAVKILVATAMDSLGDSAEYFRQRAQAMNIHIIDDLTLKDPVGMIREVKTLWCRTSKL